MASIRKPLFQKDVERDCWLRYTPGDTCVVSSSASTVGGLALPTDSKRWKVLTGAEWEVQLGVVAVTRDT